MALSTGDPRPTDLTASPKSPAPTTEELRVDYVRAMCHVFPVQEDFDAIVTYVSRLRSELITTRTTLAAVGNDVWLAREMITLARGEIALARTELAARQ